MSDSLDKMRENFRRGLLEDVVPFWLRHAVDQEHGGYMFATDRVGRVIDTDKSIWFQGRFAWMLATLWLTVDRRAEWLEQARSGVDFLLRHGFDADGRMFFQVARDGLPLRKRRYYFSEAFTVMAFAALARATDDATLASRARCLFDRILKYHAQPELLPAKTTGLRPAKSLAGPMILLNVTQTLRDTVGYPEADAVVDRLIGEIERDFLKPEYAALLETVGANGAVLDHFDGRLLNPGHAIEAAWFILHEARHRNNDGRLVGLGTQILDWMWERGWDREYGGIYYYRDLRDLPVQEYWHDMKFWWPHNETIIATLLAWTITREDRHLRRFHEVYSWTMSHFPDREYGEWFGYLHRDGSVSSTLKGNMWKGGFHIPRMQWYCWRLLESEGVQQKPLGKS
ncbi:MAG: AGE family epimerase/isomerase [Kiritimatiellia bacterium]